MTAVALPATTWTVDPDFPFSPASPFEYRHNYALALWCLADLGGTVVGPNSAIDVRSELEAYGLSSNVNVSQMLAFMERSGWIDREGGGGRGIRVTKITLLITALPPWPEKWGKPPSCYPRANGEPDRPVTPMPPPPSPHDPRPAPGEGAARLRALRDGIDKPVEPRRVQPAAFEVDRQRFNKPSALPAKASTPHGVAPVDPVEALQAQLRACADLLLGVSEEVAKLKAGPAPEPVVQKVADPEVAERLALALEEAQRLRIKCKNHEETIHAKTQENQGLHKQINQLKANAATWEENRQIEAAHRHFRDVDRTMRQVPGTTKGTDHAQ